MGNLLIVYRREGESLAHAFIERMLSHGAGQET